MRPEIYRKFVNALRFSETITRFKKPSIVSTSFIEKINKFNKSKFILSKE